MELNAYTENVSKLFSVQKKYVVPRFQRPYSWSKEQVKEFWEDIVLNIKFNEENNTYSNIEYFIGAIVLVGDESTISLQIVDGQQRLTTVTILLSAIAQRFIKIEENDIAQSLYDNYIVGKDDNGKPFFKLENEPPKPFLQKSIQSLDREDTIEPVTDEEKRLKTSYDDSYAFLSKDSVKKYLLLEGKLTDELYIQALKSIRDQLIKYLKIIRISVKDEEEAYTIFETLNARGINLSFVDLIKNSLFKSVNSTFPTDDAKRQWSDIRMNLQSRDFNSLETYVRHWWISNYSVVSADKLYRHFKLEAQAGNIDPKRFIEQLHRDSLTYIKIVSPEKEDFKRVEERKIYEALKAFKIFNVSQQRPFLLSLFRSKEDKKVKHSEVIGILEFLEGFHFVFNAICSQRPSGIEQTYAKAAKELNLATNKRESKKALNNLKEQLSTRIPDYSLFEEKFQELKFYSSYTKDKKIIQYILRKVELERMETDELTLNEFTLEHIMSQSDSRAKKSFIGKIGNLLPLSESLNSECDNKEIADKLAIYAKSELSLPKEFANNYLGSWRKSEIDERTKDLAERVYNIAVE